MNLENETAKMENFLVSISDQQLQRNIQSRNNDRKQMLKKLQVSLQHNEKCQALLASLESSLSILLEECMLEQNVIKENITMQDKRKVGDKVSSQLSKASFRKNWFSPYFKDVDGFAAPPNEDVITRKTLQYLERWGAVKTEPWTDYQKREVEKSIKKAKIENLKNLNKHTIEDDDTSQIDVTKCAEEYTLDELIGKSDEEYDWIKIAVTDLRGTRNSQECRAIWFNYLHPKINKKSWTDEEGAKLKELARQYKYQDWNGIAYELATQRSAYQCIGYFKINCLEFFKVPWTTEETALLKKYIKLFQIGNFIPWYKIAWFMDGRSTSEIYRRWKTCYANVKKGPFSLEEDILLVAGLREFGNDWSQIAEYFPNRHNIQVRGRIQVLQGRELSSTPWSSEDDDLLVKLVKEHGFGNWAKISTHFLGRNNVQVRSRYLTIQRWHKRINSGGSQKSLDARTPKPVRKDYSVDALWETAQRIVRGKRIKTESNGPDENSRLMHELSQILKPRKKPGRKLGTINDPSFQKHFNEFFHVAYAQHSGRGKNICVQEKIPTLVYKLGLALQLLDAKISLPINSVTIRDDMNILDMDKSVLEFLIDRKDLLLGKCDFVTFGKMQPGAFEAISSSDCSNDLSLNQALEAKNSIIPYPVCSPCSTTLIGMRTMLLNRFKVKRQSKGSTVQEVRPTTSQLDLNHMEPDSNYASASRLFNRRIWVLYTWAAFLSKQYPSDETTAGLTADWENASGKKSSQKRKTRKRGKKRSNKGSAKRTGENGNSDVNNDSVVIKQERTKRAYVKSGKYSVKEKVIDCPRRSSRRSNIL